jgi:hypothetical protein
MKKYLLWSFERGSRPYDVICFVILAFIFLTPSRAFNDRPDFMRIEQNEPIRRTTDDNGNAVYTVQVDAPIFASASTMEKTAVDRLRDFVHEKFEVTHTVPIYDSKGTVIAFSFWIDSGAQPF